MQTHWPKAALGAAVLATALASPLRANADEGDSLQWHTIVGIVQANNVVGSGSGAVIGGGQPWTASGGHASVNLRTGQISFEVRGLVFAGGNTIGTPLPVTQVKGTLVCDTDGSAGSGNSVLVDTPAVPLEIDGDAQFNGTVDALPAECLDNPDVAFLIRVAGLNRWIANGAILR
ncbi:MAG TPA: hypothetical protein VF428_06970 [Casimicrobiaceae bacterium]